MNDDQIEALLRQAPGSVPPPGLLARLRADITLPRPSVDGPSPSESAPWFRRWLPALGFAGCLLACAVVFAVQTGTLSQLRQENEALQMANQKLDPLRAENAGNQRLAADNQELQRLQKDNQELQQLRGEVARLRSQVGEIARLRTENQQLQAGAAASGSGKSDAEFFNRVPDARDKSERIKCVNNLKQIGLAGRIWASDHGDVFPSDFQTMINELGTPKILHCPGDGARPEAASWAEFSAANISYEMLSPGVADSDPQAVYVRCPIHNNVTLGDGSVQQLGPNLSLVTRDGKYYISTTPAGDETLRQRYGLPAANSPAPGETPATNSADEILRQRYGLPKPPNQ